MFYDIYQNLCNEINKAPSRVAIELGLNKSTVSVWKRKGVTPTGETLQKVADYFNESVDYLLEKEEEKTSPATMTEDEELAHYLEVLKNRKDMRMLFKVSENATIQDVQKAVAIIEALINN